MDFAPICLFVYNRLEHTKKTVTALQANLYANESRLFIFSDGPKADKDKARIAEVRSYLRQISGFKCVEIIENDSNSGLAKSIINGVSQVIDKCGQVIVLEDDMVTSPYFLQYMNEALNLYRNDEKVISIHGYVYPVTMKLPETFFLRGADCWGWATWQRGWKLFENDGMKLLKSLERSNLLDKFDFDKSYPFSNMLKRQIEGKNDSWAIRWYASAFLANKLTLYPGISLIDNIGQDSSGTHGISQNVYKVNLANHKIDIKTIPVCENQVARTAFTAFFDSLKPSMIRRILSKLGL